MSDRPDLPTQQPDRAEPTWLQQYRLADPPPSNLPGQTEATRPGQLSAAQNIRDPYRFSGQDSIASAPGQDARDPYRFSGPEKADTTDSGASNQQLDHARKVLMNEGISASDKLRTIQQLAAAGINHIQLPDKDGKMRDYAIREGTIGNRTMVHLFAVDDQGREHVVLRGISNSDGTFEKERDRHGHYVSFEGTWWSRHMTGRSAFSEADDQASAARDPYAYDGGRNRSVGRVGTPEYSSNNYYNGRPTYPNRSFDPRNGADPPASANGNILADVASRVASGMGTIGYCARGVARTLENCGINVAHANAWQYGHNLANSGLFEQVPLSQLRRGDIIVRSWNPSVQRQHGGQNWGDITMVVGANSRGQLIGANDHKQVIPSDGGRYENSFALRLRDSDDQSLA
ncbi:MAG TPA: hypothetical protein V6C69_08420 [Trichormus sp.]|jgi:hypothetical protein